MRVLGCAESHRRALRCLVDSGAPFGIILEDDAELAPEFRSVVEHMISQTAGWDIVRLEQRKRGVLAPTGLRLVAGRTLAVPRNMTFGSTAMLYSKRGAGLALAARRVRRLSAHSALRSAFIPTGKAVWMPAGRVRHERGLYPDRQPVDPSRPGDGVRSL